MLKVYVASHVNVPIPELPYCVNIQTGSAGKESWPGFQRDDVGDNISHKNRFFGELTGLYWVWKNSDADKIGWCHYRRFFSPVLYPQSHPFGVGVDLPMAQTILDQDRDGRLFDFELRLAPMIVPNLTHMQISPQEWYCGTHREVDWQAMLRGIAEFYPEEGQAAKDYLTSAHHQHFWCMMIANRPVFDAYCAWLFPLLFHLETLITPAEDNFLCRVYAFLSEHLFNWWRHSRNLQFVTRPFVFLNESKPAGVDQMGVQG